MSKAIPASVTLRQWNACVPFRLCFGFSRRADRERMK
jgi:hypothetical protein